MNHRILIIAGLAAAATPAAAGRYALDYRATDASCIDAGRFADEVSAKLGFVPWDTAASAAIRVRVERDGAQFTGTFRNADGTAKVVDGKTCADVTASLIVTVATAVDATSAPKPAKPTLTPGPIVAAPAPAPAGGDDKIPVTFASLDGRRIDIALNNGGGVGRASDGTTVVASYFETLCTSPCTARLQRGRNYLMFQDPEANAADGKPFIIDKPTTISLRQESRHNLRVTAFIVGALLTGLAAYELSNGGDNSVLIGSLAIGFGLPIMASPLYIHDGFDTTQRP